MSVSKEATGAYQEYKELHRRFEDGDMEVTESAVHDAYNHYLDVHGKHDAPHGYEHYSPYYLATARRHESEPQTQTQRMHELTEGEKFTIAIFLFIIVFSVLAGIYDFLNMPAM